MSFTQFTCRAESVHASAARGSLTTLQCRRFPGGTGLSVDELGEVRKVQKHGAANLSPGSPKAERKGPSTAIEMIKRHDAATFAIAAGMGAIAGMRSMAAPALLSRHFTASRRAARRGGVTSFLASRTASGILTGVAAGEMMADKTPVVPDRTEVPAATGRIVMGALVGFAAADYRRSPRIPAAAVGALAALGSTHFFYYVRSLAGKNTPLPDAVWGTVEDLLVVAAGNRLTGLLDRK